LRWRSACHAGHFQRQLDVLPHGLGRHQVEVLEDHADAPAQGHQAVFIEVADVHLVDQHARPWLVAPGG
jgi:hypothetical protein